MDSIASILNWIMREIGFAVCHQIPERSLHYGGEALPVCARDTGFFIGFSVCFLVLLLAFGAGRHRFPSWKAALVLACFLLPMVIDACTSYAGLRETGNALRIITGALGGTGVAALVFPLATGFMEAGSREDGNPGEDDPAGPFSRWWHIAGLVLVPLGVSLALRPRWPGAYWFWAPLVTLSVLFTFLVLNTALMKALLAGHGRSGRDPGAPAVLALAALASAVEIIVFNRLHWLAERLL